MIIIVKEMRFTALLSFFKTFGQPAAGFDCNAAEQTQTE